MKIAFTDKAGTACCCLCDWINRGLKGREQESMVRQHLYGHHDKLLITRIQLRWDEVLQFEYFGSR